MQKQNQPWQPYSTKLNNFLIYFKAEKKSKNLDQNPSWANED